jgi:hypothetical protein
MSRPRINGASRAIAAAVALGVLVAGCSDIYTDRRDTIALAGGDAVAANGIEQMVDPWPPYSNNNNLTFNGERMQRAVQCYRADKVSQPADLDTSSATSAAGTASASAACEGQMTIGSAPAAMGTAVGGGSASMPAAK